MRDWRDPDLTRLGRKARPTAALLTHMKALTAEQAATMAAHLHDRTIEKWSGSVSIHEFRASALYALAEVIHDRIGRLAPESAMSAYSLGHGKVRFEDPRWVKLQSVMTDAMRSTAVPDLIGDLGPRLIAQWNELVETVRSTLGHTLGIRASLAGSLARAVKRVASGPSAGLLRQPPRTSGLLPKLHRRPNDGPVNKPVWNQPNGRSVSEWLDQERPWRLESCGHRHRFVADHVGPAAQADQGQTFRLDRALPKLLLQVDGVDGDHWVSLEAGTLVRCDAPNGYGDPCSDIYWDSYRCLILSGPLAGQCVEIPDAGTPDGDWPTNRGSRPTLGMPGERMASPAGLPNG